MRIISKIDSVMQCDSLAYQVALQLLCLKIEWESAYAYFIYLIYVTLKL